MASALSAKYFLLWTTLRKTKETNKKPHFTIAIYLDFTFKTTFYYDKEDTGNGVSVGSVETFS